MGKLVTTKSMEKRGKEKIAKLLTLMGFRNDNPAATGRIMRQRLREIEERSKFSSQRSMIKKIIIKFGGKKSVVVGSDDHHMEIIDHSSSENPSSKMIGYNNIDDDEVYQGFEERRLMMVHNNNNDNEGGVMEFNNMEINPNLPPENPNADMIIDENKDGEMDIQEFITSMGGSEAVLVIEKTLTRSDCNVSQGRLLIPALQVINNGFLTMNEKHKLEMRESISVEVFDPKRRKLMLNLAQWKMKHENYVLKTNWNTLVLTNKLKENMVIQVLSFKVDQRLCFAVVRV